MEPKRWKLDLKLEGCKNKEFTAGQLSPAVKYGLVKWKGLPRDAKLAVRSTYDEFYGHAKYMYEDPDLKPQRWKFDDIPESCMNEDFSAGEIVGAIKYGVLKWEDLPRDAKLAIKHIRSWMYTAYMDDPDLQERWKFDDIPWSFKNKEFTAGQILAAMRLGLLGWNELPKDAKLEVKPMHEKYFGKAKFMDEDPDLQDV